MPGSARSARRRLFRAPEFSADQPPGPAGAPFVTGYTPGGMRNNFAGSIGFKFTLGATPVTVTHLGRWVYAGNSATHLVRILRASDDVVVASAVVATSGQTVGSISLTALGSSVQLLANTAYYLISEEASGGDTWSDDVGSTLTVSTGTVNDSRYQAGSTGVITPNLAGVSYVPPSFIYV